MRSIQTENDIIKQLDSGDQMEKDSVQILKEHPKLRNAYKFLLAVDVDNLLRNEDSTNKNRRDKGSKGN